MSGICAVWSPGDSLWGLQTLNRLNAGHDVLPGDRSAIHSADLAGVGLCAGCFTQQIYENTGFLLACDADLTNLQELIRITGATRESVEGEAGLAALLASLYQRFGSGMFENLRGAFAAIVVDPGRQELIAAVDPFAIKRLAWGGNARQLAIGTRAEAVARSGVVSLQVDPRAIADIVNFTAALGPGTMFNGVERLPPGTILKVSRSAVRIDSYWTMRYYSSGPASEEKLSRELEATVETSVAAHSAGLPDMELGTFLSGGTDSSTITGMLTRVRANSVDAFSIGFQDEEFNELEYAGIATRNFHARHHQFLVGPDDCLAALPAIVRAYDQPAANSSAVPTYFCARLAASEGMQTLLAGDGGDELFAGNEWYATDKIFETYHSVPALVRKGVIEPALSILPIRNGIVGRAKRYVRKANMPCMERVLSYQLLAVKPLNTVFADDFVNALGDYSTIDVPQRLFNDAPAHHDLDRLLYVDTKITLADNDLPKVTLMCELAGIRPRFPFLDRSVAEMSGCIPPRLKLKGFNKRYLFKKAFRALLPSEIIQKRKHGFGIPVARWLKSHPGLRELANDTMRSRRALERGYFRQSFIDDLFEQHQSDETTWYGDTLWTLLMLELWHAQAVDQPLKTAL